jgi:FdhD protein
VNSRPTRPVDVVRVEPAGRDVRSDWTAAEEPLEIRLHGSPFVVTMRTPGADVDLVAGFLLSERIIASADDIGTVRHCAGTDASSGAGADPASAGNVIDVVLVGEAAQRAASALAGRRLVMASSACGVCGRRSIDDLMRGRPAITAGWAIGAAVIARLPPRLRAAQAAFDETGGLHAAGLFDRDGVLTGVAEDVGRHNAVDKVIGARLLQDGVPLSDSVLCVSGRTSFEIIQKAVVAGIPVIAAVSAPSSLAIELARSANLTLLGFVRGDTFNIYSGADRIS